MTLTYANAMTGWLDWREPYRFGVILVLPPGSVRTGINALRAKYDPLSHNGVEAHISLTVPLQKKPDDRQRDELERIIADFQAFRISYGPLVPFLSKPGAAHDIRPQARLDEIVARWRETSFSTVRHRAHPFWAHMTIAEFVSVEITEQLVRDLDGSVHLVPTPIFGDRLRKLRRFIECFPLVISRFWGAYRKW